MLSKKFLTILKMVRKSSELMLRKHDSDNDPFRKKKNKKLNLDLGFSRRLFSSDDHELDGNANIKKPTQHCGTVAHITTQPALEKAANRQILDWRKQPGSTATHGPHPWAGLWHWSSYTVGASAHICTAVRIKLTQFSCTEAGTGLGNYFLIW